MKVKALGIKNRFKRFCLLAGMITLSAFGGCQQKKNEIRMNETKQSIRCYDYKDKTLSVYAESKEQGQKMNRNEIGEELTLNFSALGIKDEKENSNPLAYFCTRDGHLFWITNEMIFIKKIAREGNRFSVGKILEARYVDPDEYAVQGVRVISADVWHNPDVNWEKITTATLTNTGLFQVARYSQNAIANDEPDRAIFNLKDDNEIDLKNRWPKESVERGVVNVLNRNEFAIVPLGERGIGDVRNHYYYAFDGDAPRIGKWRVSTMKHWKRNPELKNIFEISKPVRYDKNLGGWIINLLSEKDDGTELPLFSTLTPEKAK